MMDGWMDGWVEWGFITVDRMMEGSLPSLVFGV
jgi:hypothetical protein